MGSPYLIEIRMLGKARDEIKELILDTSKRFNIDIHRPVPHITLVGPFDTEEETRLIKDFKSICRNTTLISYVIEGIDIFRDNGVIYLDVQPSNELISFRKSFRDKLKPYCTLSRVDITEPFVFHATIVKNIRANKVLPIKRRMQQKLRYSHRMLRLTLLKNGKILYEYDFVLKRLLSRHEALDREILTLTFAELKSLSYARKDKTLESKDHELSLEKQNVGTLTKISKFLTSKLHGFISKKS